MDIETVFCEIDDFYKVFEVVWRKHLLAGGRMRNRRTQLSLSEVVMTILVIYHESGYKNLKSFYLREIGVKYRREFPSLISYNRFIELQIKGKESKPKLEFHRPGCFHLLILIPNSYDEKSTTYDKIN